MKTNLQRKTKTQLWIMMCERGIVTGDVSLYRMKYWTKQEMIDALEKELKEE